MRKSKILLIEDTESISDELKDILGFEGYDVYLASNGQLGIDLAKKIIPDLILCDVMMPLKDGYQVFSEVKHVEELVDTPFIFLTAKAQNENLREGMIMGADDYITKPFDMDMLILAIQTRLNKEICLYKLKGLISE